MITAKSTLADVCFAVSVALEAHGIVLARTDCIRDRLAHFYFWSDYIALNAAVAVAAPTLTKPDIDVLRAWTERESPALLEKFAEFERRLRLDGKKRPQRASRR